MYNTVDMTNNNSTATYDNGLKSRRGSRKLCPEINENGVVVVHAAFHIGNVYGGCIILFLRFDD